MPDKDESQLIPPHGLGGYAPERGSAGEVSDVDKMIAQKVSEHTGQIKNIQNCIMTDEGKMNRQGYHIAKLKDRFDDNEHLVQLHADDIKELMGLFQALALRISRIEEQLGITEPVVVPGD